MDPPDTFDLARLDPNDPPPAPWTIQPSNPELLNALARFDPFPRIAGPDVDVAPPRAAIARDPQVRAASAGVVKVHGTACGLGVQGSGWVAAKGVVVIVVVLDRAIVVIEHKADQL